jgi:ribosomal protein S12 methylthiotransferase accessory factor
MGNITGLDNIGIAVAVACRPNSRALSVAQGKGLSFLAAEVSAAMESIESYHAEHITRPLLLATWEQIRGSHPAIDPALLPKSAVGRFRKDLKLHWVEGFDLLQNRTCWVPYELVHTDFALPLPSDSGCFPLSSNGLASGNHPYEAISHGLCELIERDAEALFACEAAHAQRRRVVTHGSIDAPECHDLLARFERAGVQVGIWDITSNLEVAAFRVVIADKKLDPARPLRPHVGLGCHPSRAVALTRALTEAAQARLTVISSSRDDLQRERYADARDLDRLKSLRAQEAAGPGVVAFGSIPDFASNDVAEDLAWLREQLARCRFQHAVVVDLTKPEFDIPVVRVIIPGLETSREVPGWVPGKRALAATQGVRQ